MKKQEFPIICVCLAVVMLLCLWACAGDVTPEAVKVPEEIFGGIKIGTTKAEILNRKALGTQVNPVSYVMQSTEVPLAYEEETETENMYITYIYHLDGIEDDSKVVALWTRYRIKNPVQEYDVWDINSVINTHLDELLIKLESECSVGEDDIKSAERSDDSPWVQNIWESDEYILKVSGGYYEYEDTCCSVFITYVETLAVKEI
ncbi:MAG: hypothetical protein E7218_03500 [Anaerofustis stercorihominis]|nr:hypothetical protein [Anaerofustis stercorihominis]